MILTEKYKPQKFEEIIGIDDSIPKLVNSELPNFLFFGTAGTGKTTTACVITKERDFIKINASDDRGIETIREKIKIFASTQGLNNGKKVIVLDEADGLTSQAQEILRGVIDNYSNNCSFILTCNFVNKIIDPLKSRCVNIEFKVPDRQKIIERLEFICKNENINFEIKGLENIVKETYPDIRRAIKELEVVWKKFDVINEETTGMLKNRVKVLIEYLKKEDFMTAVKIYENEIVDEEELFVLLADEMFFGEYPLIIKKKALEIIRISYVQLSRIKTKKIVIRPFLLQIIDMFKEVKTV